MKKDNDFETPEMLRKAYDKKMALAQRCWALGERILQEVGDKLDDDWKMGFQLAWDSPALQICNHEKIDRLDFKKALILLSVAFKTELKPSLFGAAGSDKEAFWTASATVDGVPVDVRGTRVVGCQIETETQEVRTSKCFDTFITVESKE